MVIAIVNILVVYERINEFIELTIQNVTNSRKEEGITHFELIQDIEKPNHFMLLEYFKDTQAQESHRKTVHYMYWKTKVEEMMEIPRTSTKYNPIPIPIGE